MWRVIRWLIPLALIAFGLLWPLVFSGGVGGLRRRGPGGLQQLQGGLRRQQRRPARRGGDDHRRIPQRPARHLPVLGRRQPEQPAGAAEARDHLDPARRRAGPVPDAVGGRRTVPGGQDRRSRTSTSAMAPTSSRSATPSPACSTPAPPAPTRPSPTTTGEPSTTAVGVLLERHRPVLEQPDRTGRHLGDAARRRRRRAVLRRLRRRAGPAAT